MKKKEKGASVAPTLKKTKKKKKSFTYKTNKIRGVKENSIRCPPS